MICSFRDRGTEDVYHGRNTAAARRGEHSIRIHDQHRICFVWTASGPAEVTIDDYHD